MKLLVFLAGVIVGGAAWPIGAQVLELTNSLPVAKTDKADAPPQERKGAEMLRTALANEEAMMFEKAKQSVGENLFDPYSAVFSEMKVVKTVSYGVRVCGTVNAKNKMGGYVGRTPFSYSPADNISHVIGSKKDAFIAGTSYVWPCLPDYKIPENAREALAN